jgi:serine/threonine-protein kinase RsbT
MNSLYNELSATLARYLSAVHAGSLLSRALEETRTSPRDLSLRDMPAVLARLDRVVRLFVAPDRQTQALAELHALSDQPALGGPTTLEVRAESDISRARLEAKALCDLLGARRTTTQKVATIVSELARNIASYTPGGSIELTPVEGSPRRIRVRAKDGGTGIAQLDAILQGTYRSQTGLGKGIFGVKRLADEFHIETGRTGTRIDVEIKL